jgi:hypothetical protein
MKGYVVKDLPAGIPVWQMMMGVLAAANPLLEGKRWHQTDHAFFA